MKLDILQLQIADFAHALGSRDSNIHAYKYAMLDNFRTHWTFDTEDFGAMYDRALQSDVTRRWWKRTNYRPKDVMLLLIAQEEQYVREAFKELFNESKVAENRVDRFVFYCDELLRMYKKANPRSVENNHYQDSVMISLYLAALYPDRYTLYPGPELFNRALGVLGAQGTGTQDDLPRFFKLTRTLYTYLLKNAFISEFIKNDLRPEGHLLLVHEYLYFVAGAWAETTPA